MIFPDRLAIDTTQLLCMGKMKVNITTEMVNIIKAVSTSNKWDSINCGTHNQ